MSQQRSKNKKKTGKQLNKQGEEKIIIPEAVSEKNINCENKENHGKTLSPQKRNLTNNPTSIKKINIEKTLT